MSDRNRGFFFPYVPAAQRVARMKKQARKLARQRAELHPVQSRLRKIAATWWGRAWCSNLEAYSDYSNRLPRGRSYLSNGSVLDLAVTGGMIRAQVAGTRLYQVEIAITRLPSARWQAIAAEVGGRLASLVELLEGRFSDAVMTVLTRPGKGLFPAPREIKLGCDCPDWATMCKHVAAALYGVGVRLDEDPRLLFTLRGVDESELIAGTAAAAGAAAPADRDLDPAALSALFGIDLADPSPAPGDSPAPADRPTGKPARRKAKPAAPARAKRRRR